MVKAAAITLRVTLGITFLWIGWMVFQDPEGWSGYIRPDALWLIPGDPISFMEKTAVLDMILGALLIIGLWPWIMGLLAGVHLLGIIATIYVGESTVRDIGLTGASFALTLLSPMPRFIQKLLRRSR